LTANSDRLSCFGRACAEAGGRIAGRLRRRCRNAFRQLRWTRARYVGQVRLKPGEGVRSVGYVFNLIVFENGLLAGVLSGSPSAGARPAPITDPEKLQEALKASYVNLQKAITGLSDNDLRTTVKLFGRDWTKQDAVMHVLQDQHEHLGQSIAYARTNGVVPPWSK